MRKNERGDAEVVLAGLFVLFIIGLFLAILFVRFNTSIDRVSGIVYNTTNDSFIGGNTRFSIRASVDTYIDKDSNESSFCLPKGSPYIDLVNRAAEDKTVKVVVVTDKFFAIQSPWACYPNVKVTEIK